MADFGTRLAAASALTVLAASLMAPAASAQNFPISPTQRATVSLGLVHSASMGGNADMDTLLLAADAALYRAKAEGRNRVALA